MTANGYRASLWDDKNVPKLMVVAQLCKRTKNIELYTLSG